jgi:hypothetical protein
VADLSAQVEAFLRNALRQKKLEDRLVGQSLRDLRRTLVAVERVVGQSGVLSVGPQRDQAIARVVEAVARSVRDSFGEPQLQVLQEALVPFVDQQLTFARKMVEMAGGDLSQPAVAMTPMQASRMVNQAVVAGKTLEAQLGAALPSLVADRVERYIRLGLSDASGETVHTYQDAVVRVTERNVEALIRTGVHEVGSQAQGLIYEFETDPAWLGPDGLVWTAILDSRVCPVCVSLDGRRYEVGTPAAYFDGRNKISPHPQCRCYLVPWKWRNEDMQGPNGPEPTKRPAQGDGGGTDALSFRKAAKTWVKDNPETAQAIFGKKLGQQLVDGKISFDQAVRQWRQPKA